MRKTNKSNRITICLLRGSGKHAQVRPGIARLCGYPAAKTVFQTHAANKWPYQVRQLFIEFTLNSVSLLKKLMKNSLAGQRLFINFMLMSGCLFMVSGCSPSQADLQDSKGNRISVSHLRGKWVLLNYWATWCAPCVREIPVLNQFAQQYAQQVRVFAVNYDNLPAKQLNQLADQLAIHYPLLQQDPQPVFAFTPVSVVPTTIVVDPQGTVRDALLGPQTLASLKKAVGLP